MPSFKTQERIGGCMCMQRLCQSLAEESPSKRRRRPFPPAPVAPPAIAEPSRYSIHEDGPDDDMDDGPTLFSLPGNPYARCAEMVIAHKGLHIQVRTLQATAGLTSSAAYKSINPRGTVPVLIDFRGGENVVVYEALAISQYLESEYPQVPLLPASAADRATVFTRFMEVVNLLSAAMKISDLLYFEDDESRDMGELKSAVKDVFKELAYWEKYLSGRSRYLVGNCITLADTAFYPVLAFVYRLGFEPLIELKLGKIATYYSNVSGTECARKTLPPMWAGKPPSKKFVGLITKAYNTMKSN